MHTKDCLKDLVLEGDPCTCQEKEEVCRSCYYGISFVVGRKPKNCPCPCHHPAEDWEKEFDKKYGIKNTTEYWKGFGEDIKSFIRQTLATEKEKWEKQGYFRGVKDESECCEISPEHHIECKKESRQKLLKELEDKMPKELDYLKWNLKYRQEWDKGYNQALSEIKNILKIFK